MKAVPEFIGTVPASKVCGKVKFRIDKQEITIFDDCESKTEVIQTTYAK